MQTKQEEKIDELSQTAVNNTNRLSPRQQSQESSKNGQKTKRWENYYYSMYGNYNHLLAEQVSTYMENSKCCCIL